MIWRTMMQWQARGKWLQQATVKLVDAGIHGRMDTEVAINKGRGVRQQHQVLIGKVAPSREDASYLRDTG